MKKIIYLFTILSLFLNSCSSNDNNSNGNNSSDGELVGKWEVYQVKSFPAGTVITGNESLMNFNFACSSNKDYVQFGSQGTAKFATYDSNCNEESNVGTYIKSDFIINFYQNNVYENSWEILSLNSSSLKVKYPNPPTGTPEEIIVMSFKKN